MSSYLKKELSLNCFSEWLKLRRGADLEPIDFVTTFSMGHLKTLHHLDISECSKIDDAGMIAIAKNCPTLGTLRRG